MSMNQAAHRAFDAFLNAVAQEAEEVRILAPVLNAEGAFDGLPHPDLESARSWFEIVEPLLYAYLFKVPGALIEGRAINAAEGLTEASFFHLEDPQKAYSVYEKTGQIGDGQYKLLSSKLVVGPQKEPVVIEAEEFDDWLELKAGAAGWGLPIILRPYDEQLWLVPDEDDPDTAPAPALAPETLEEAANRWRLVCETRPPRTHRAARRRRDEWAGAQGRIRQGRIEEARQQRRAHRLEIVAKHGQDLRDPLLVCAVRTKKKFENKELSKDAPASQTKVPRMAERARALGEEPKRRLRIVNVKHRWEVTAKECGLLLEPRDSKGELIGFEAPPEDVLFADEIFDENVLEMPSPLIAGLWSRNHLTKPDGRKKDRKPDLFVARSLERRRRDRVDARGRPWSVERKLKEMGDKYPKGAEPRTYLLGARTGNLYPVKFIRYAEHLQAYLPEEFREKYGHLFTDETVLARLLRQAPYVPEGRRLPFVYLPQRERLVVCFEDELVNVVQGQERMKLADLHRYLES
jgi:hypothetical protein